MKFKNRMKKFFTLTRESAGGFTLVELIVVIAILGILAGVAIPAYSGYIKKANAAADLQLLDAVNTAFSAACVDNGIDPYSLVAGQAAMPLTSEGKVNVANIKPAVIIPSFQIFFAGNEDGVFKTYTALTYDQTQGMFKQAVLSDAYSALLGTFGADDIAALKGSTFGQMGVTNLLGAVDMASGVAAGMFGEDTDPRIDALVNSSSNLETLAKVLGCTSADDPNFEAAYENLIAQKVAQLANDPKYSGYTQAQLEDAAAAAIMSNNAVLSVATNSNFNATSFAAQLANGTAEKAIQDNLAADGDLEMGLSQAALTYALYTSYAQQNNIEVNQENALASVLGALDDPGFKEYAGSEQAATDVEGYLAAMNMVNSSYENTDVATDILVNGFSNEELLLLLQGTLG